MASYQHAPVDYCTGIPGISYDLLSLPTTSSDLGFTFKISYHPNNVAIQQKISQVGKGWSLIGIPSISKDANGQPDEEVPFRGPNPFSRKVDDIYYYNINGENGRFTFEFDLITKVASLKFLDKTQLKIEFNYNTEYNFKVNSFLVTDTNGLKYYFDLFNNDEGNVRSTFFLTKVLDSSNKLLSTLNYQQVFTQNSVRRLQTVYALDEIIATNIGKLKFNYTIDSKNIDKNIEIARLDNISLRNLNNTLIKKCLFGYSGDHELNFLHHLDVNNTIVEKYKFLYEGNVYSDDPDPYNYVVGGSGNGGNYSRGYDYYGFRKIVENCNLRDRIIETPIEIANKNSVKAGLLKSVVLPTGGRVDYEFESNTIDPLGYVGLPGFHLTNHDYPKDYDFSDYDYFSESYFTGHNFEDFTLKPIDPLYEELHLSYNQDNFYIETVRSDAYNVEPNQLTRPFRIMQDTELYISFSGQGNPSPYIEDPSAQNLNIGYQLLDANLKVKAASGVSNSEAQNCYNLSEKIFLPAGYYTLKIIAPFGGNISYQMYTVRQKAEKKYFYYAGGVRIKSIKHFEDANSNTPIRNLSFSYNDFTIPSRSSGTLFETGTAKFMPSVGYISGAFVLYKNVKVSEDNNGYTKYSYYTPTDGINYDISGVSTFYYGNVLKTGLLHSIKTFDNENNLLTTDRKYYLLAPTNNYQYYSSIDNLSGYSSGDLLISYIGNYKVRNYYIERIYSKYTRHFPTLSLTSKSIYSYNNWNPKPSIMMSFNSQDKMSRTSFFYLNERPNTPFATELLAKNMVSDVIETERYYDGELLNKSKSEFAYFGNNLYKNSKEFTAKGQGDYTLEKRISVVDNISGTTNEVTNDKGSFTSYIWGYNLTKPVAKIENIQYAAIPTNLILAIQSATNVANNDQNILIALTNLRNNMALANAMITTYTYKQLVGISTVTDPKGDRQTYHYDEFNRLEFVKDSQGNILSENKYHYRTQN
ncbi:hypothetical protein ACFSX9_04365 [Flavobacterium ardleyense]|uniref:YD repeat-containing protein n=1 Tax=Flavobacterium ardleyense TaxID=2038737 RepID=A0ABW5Z5N6_9FLAO